MPSSANGVVGLKPTYGRVSRYGVIGMSPSLDHVGPMARSVADAAIMFEAISGHDQQDPTSLNEPPSNVLGQIDQGIKNLRIGLDRTYALEGIDRGQAVALENAVKALEKIEPGADREPAVKPKAVGKRKPVAKTKAIATAKPAAKAKSAAGRTKTDQVIAALREPAGATLKQLTAITGWQPHSVRGFLSAHVSKRMGLRVKSIKRDGERVYRAPS
jgi:Asp-tRNA(Asn)/Glu-tRNA(Gln) amidotransferase A subunit family amidase